MESRQCVGEYLHRSKTVPGPGGWTEYPPAHTFGQTPNASLTTQDIVTPGFKRKSAKGEIINNAFISELTEVFPWQPTSISNIDTYRENFFNTDTGQWETDDIGFITEGTCVPWQYWGNTPGFLVSPPGTAELRQQVIDLAVTDAASRVNTSEMLAGATMAEMHKTTDFLVQTSRRAIRIFQAARRLDLLSAANAIGVSPDLRGVQRSGRSRNRNRVLRNELSPQEIANRYMELRYAVRPLIIDMVNTLKAIDSKKGRIRKTFRGMKTGDLSHEDVMVGQGYFFRTAVDVSRSHKYVVAARAGILCDVDFSNWSAFGMDNPVQTMWELMPFSFIADWFGNIGSWIGAMSPRAGVNQLASWVTVTETFTAKNMLVNARSAYPDRPNQVGNSSSVGSSSSVIRVTRKERIVSPVLRTWPQVDINLNLYKLTDLSIILKGIFRGR